MSHFDLFISYGCVFFIFTLLICAEISCSKANEKSNKFDEELQKLLLKETNELKQRTCSKNAQVENSLKEAG